MTKLEEFWDALFPLEIIEIVVNCTNLQIEEHCARMIEREQDIHTYHHHTDVEEMKAFIALFYYIGSWKSTRVNTHDLWSHQNGISFYRCVMPRARFMFLSTCLRFDNTETRNRDDRFAPIRQVWELFIKNCTACYQPGRDTTVDEILLGFRGRSKFRMYIKSKPDKYGLKFFSLNDPSTSYLIYALPYLGKIKINDKLKEEQLTEYYFRKTTECIHGTERTVTCDNWFTSVPLVQRMMKEPYNLKITGTIRKNKTQIPAEMTVCSKEVPDSKFCHAQGMTLVTFTPKKNKIVLLITSDKNTTNVTGEKPDIVLHYNSTKGGTDCFDWLCHSYTVAAKTNRWPMRVFLGILDIAAVNSRILFKCYNVNNKINKEVRMKHCLDKLSLHLATPFLQRRLSEMSLRLSLRKGIMTILNMNSRVESSAIMELNTKKRCGLCKRQQDRKSRFACPSCERPVCEEHRAALCVDCIGRD